MTQIISLCKHPPLSLSISLSLCLSTDDNMHSHAQNTNCLPYEHARAHAVVFFETLIERQPLGEKRGGGSRAVPEHSLKTANQRQRTEGKHRLVGGSGWAGPVDKGGGERKRVCVGGTGRENKRMRFVLVSGFAHSRSRSYLRSSLRSICCTTEQRAAARTCKGSRKGRTHAHRFSHTRKWRWRLHGLALSDFQNPPIKR